MVCHTWNCIEFKQPEVPVAVLHDINAPPAIGAKHLEGSQTKSSKLIAFFIA